MAGSNTNPGTASHFIEHMATIHPENNWIDRLKWQGTITLYNFMMLKYAEQKYTKIDKHTRTHTNLWP